MSLDPNINIDILLKNANEKEFVERWLDYKCDIRFWAVLPSLNLNFHCKEIEIEWLCFGLYIGKQVVLSKKS